MKFLRLIRVTERGGATMGVLCIDGAPAFVTLEEAWRDNQKMVSCIPAGKYKVLPRKSPKFGNTWQVMNVPNRDHILFHAGNTHRDTLGCILLGLQYGTLGNDSAILASRSAFKAFLELMADAPGAELTIVDATGRDVH
jgi:hypothetical protein